MGNALQNNPKFDNQADDTSEHDTDLLLNCVSFQCKRKKKTHVADENSLQKRASLLRIEKENEERERKLREIAERRRQEERDRREKEVEAAERRHKEALEAARRRRERKHQDEKPLCAIFDIFKTREKTPEELRAKEEAQRLKREEKERRQAEKERAAAQRARENEERRARELADKRDSLGDYVCCPPFNKLTDSLADEDYPRQDKRSERTPEEFAAQERMRNEKEEAERQRELDQELARLEKENAKKLQHQEEEAKKAQEKADNERQRLELLDRELKQKVQEETEKHKAKLAERERKEREMEEAEKQKAFMRERKSLERERGRAGPKEENSDLDLKWCGNFCRRPQSKASARADAVKKELMSDRKAEFKELQPVEEQEIKPLRMPSSESLAKTELKPEPVPIVIREPMPCPPCPQPTVIETIAKGAQTDSIICQPKVEKVDTTTMVTSSLTFEEKVLKNAQMEKIDTHTMVTPHSSFDDIATKLADFKNGEAEKSMIPPILSGQEKTTELLDSKKTMATKIDATTMVTPRSSFQEKAVKQEDLKNVEAQKTMIPPFLSFQETSFELIDQKKNMVTKVDVTTMMTPTSSFEEKASKKLGLTKAEAEKTMVSPSLGYDEKAVKQEQFQKADTKKMDADTMVTGSLLFEAESSKKQIKVEQSDATPFFTPISSQEPRATIKQEYNADKQAPKGFLSAVEDSLDLSTAVRNAKKEIEALERALKIKSESSKTYDTTQDDKKPLGLLTVTERPYFGKRDATTQFKTDDMMEASSSAKSSKSGTTTARTSGKRDRSNQTPPFKFDFDYDSSEKIMTATWQAKPSGLNANPKSTKTDKNIQTDCDCGGRPSMTAINVKEAVSHRTGLNVIKRSIATQTEFCTCNYEESSLSSYTSTDEYYGRK